MSTDAPQPATSPSPLASRPPKARLEALLRRVRGRRRCLVLTHDNPDPDALASALALKSLLERRASVQCEIAYGGIVGRSENAAFLRVLKVGARPVAEVRFEDFDLHALVDTQQSISNHALPADLLAEIVIDHHPVRQPPPPNVFADLGGAAGATSTILTEYLRAAEIEPTPEVATALYYGIKADTRDLERQTIERDIDCYLWLFSRISRAMLAEIEHPALPLRYFKLYHAAIERARRFPGCVMTDLGEVYSPDMVAEVSERLSFLEGTVWSLAFGSYHNQLYLSLRCADRRMNAGRLIREVCVNLGGSAGGHGSMAGARIPLAGTRLQRAAIRRSVIRRFKAAFGVEGRRGTRLLSDDGPAGA